MTATSSTAPGTGYVLVHHARSPAFAPVQLSHAVTFLGRVVGNDVVLNSPNVSRRHAKLIVTDLGVTAHDLDSHNGIFLNGKKVRSTPLTPGDLLYVGDVCVELKRGGTSPFDTGSHTAVVNNGDVDDEPHARALAATLRIARLAADGADDAWIAEAIEVCRELVEGGVAAFVVVHEDGTLDSPVVLQPEGDASRRGAAPIRWPLVDKVVADGVTVFSRDVVADGLVGDDDAEVADDQRAVMAIPVVPRGGQGPDAVIYLAAARAGSCFGELEVEALLGVAQMIALRRASTGSGARDDGDDDNEPTGVHDDAGALMEAQQQIIALAERLQREQDELQRAIARAHAVETDNLKLRQQADLDRAAALKRDTDRDRDLQQRLEQATFEARRAGQRDAASAGREQSQQLQETIEQAAAQQRELQELVDAACAERDALLDQSEAMRADIDAVRREYDAAWQELTALRIAVAAHDADDSIEVEKRRADAAEAALERAHAESANVAAAALAERDRFLAEIARLEESDRELQLRAEDDARRVAERQALVQHQAEQLRQALRTSVLPTVVDHIEAVVAGETTTTAPTSRAITAVHLALADFDVWCERADPVVVKTHLDLFCAAVATRAQACGGRIEQVVGHAHVLSFAADAAGARAAVRCALDVAAIVERAVADDASLPGMLAGLHAGTSVTGFFGDDDAVSSVQAGLPFVIARAAIDAAPRLANGARGVVISDAVRAALGADARVTRLDAAWIRGVNAPVQLALVDSLDAAGVDERGAP